jgi:hypothetical protein
VLVEFWAIALIVAACSKPPLDLLKGGKRIKKKNENNNASAGGACSFNTDVVYVTNL